ncbi:MAG: hypothetical protein QGG40_03455 [Myxococcota bacterium]|nr:hypothetical protein [Myxococcota bacterium]
MAIGEADWCYAGSGLDNLISHDQPEGWRLVCLEDRQNLEHMDEEEGEP